MADIDVTQVLRDGREELKRRVQTRQDNDRRIAELRIMLRGLARFTHGTFREEVLAEVRSAKRKAPSLSNALMDALMRHPPGMTSNELRDDLELGGFDLEEYSQPLATIQSTLARMVESGHVKRRLNKDKSVTYQAQEFSEKRVGDVTGPNSAYDSGMRGNEKPK